MEKPIRRKKAVNLPVLLLTAAILTSLVIAGLVMLEIDADITASLPQSDPFLRDARQVIIHHPVQDLLVVDISLHTDNPDRLVEAGKRVEEMLRESGLFVSVGAENLQTLLPELIAKITANLPILFSRNQMDENVAPLLAPEKIRQILKTHYESLQDIDSIGKSFSISQDPLGLSQWVTKRLAGLSPSRNARFYRGAILSADNRHLLVIADPERAATDTRFAQDMTEHLEQISARLHRQYAGQGLMFTLTPTGSYRYALDNERIARKDTRRAIFLATAGIAVLLLITFPRPLIGIFAFVPAVAGTIISFFIFALTHDTISILALGFGGALISITVDHGIAYLLFLDQQYQTFGRKTAKEVWSVGWMATLTTAAAFSMLAFSGFPVLSQVGQFAAVGILCSFLFVHTIFPFIFPAVPPADRRRPSVIQNGVNRFALSARNPKAFIALVLFGIMLFFAKPVFQANLADMNTVTPETARAEQMIKETWGDLFDRIYLMAKAETLDELRFTGDALSTLLHADMLAGELNSAFIPSMIFPGNNRARSNFAAWKSFWHSERTAAFEKTIRDIARDVGFKSDAFDPFIRQINATSAAGMEIPEPFSGCWGYPARWTKMTAS